MHSSCHSSVPESVFYEEASGIMVAENRQSRAYFSGQFSARAGVVLGSALMDGCPFGVRR